MCSFSFSLSCKALWLFAFFFFLLILTSCQTPLTPSAEKDTFSPNLSQALNPKQKVSLRLTQQGEEALLRGSLMEASNTLAKAIDLDPANPYAYYFLGEINFQKGDHQQSLAFLEKSEGLLQNAPYWLSKIHALRGVNYEAINEWTKAQDYFEKALRENRRNLIAQEGLDRILEREKTNLDLENETH